MSEVSQSLLTWSQAGKAEWKAGLKKISQLKINITQASGAEKNTIDLQNYFQALQRIIIRASGYYESVILPGFKHQTKSHSTLGKALDEVFNFATISASPGYEGSFANPRLAVKMFGQEQGYLLCYVYGRFRSYLGLCLQQRFTDLDRLHKLFFTLLTLAENYNYVKPDTSSWHKAIRKLVLTDLEWHQLFGMYWRYSPEQDYYFNIIMKADLSDTRYLYLYGVPISEPVLKLAGFMQAYPEQELQQLSRYIVKSYEDGFDRGYRSYKTKKYVMLIIPAGMERLGRMLIKDLKKINLQAVVTQPQTQPYDKQYDYDHRFSQTVYYDEAYVKKLIPAQAKAVRQWSDILALQAGPIYLELFGEKPFYPKDNPAAFKLSDEQRQLTRSASGQMSQMFYKYYKQETTSFCIIAFPSPEIGSRFKQIFADTVKINLLDSLHYAAIQQHIIDVLDTAEYVHVKGRGANQTDIRVRLHPLKNPHKETNFENCVADVNIPVGEVFTSPLLTGTNGVLHVKESYLRNLRYKNLKLTFTDGMITDYSCSNFRDQAKNRKYIEENLLLPHKTLPIGEFAIGTNTLAYQVALKYDILGLLPILILEKMGPHFAVGDTCYTREEDVDHFNFVNGKKLIAVDNEKTALRKKDPMQAYTQTHTDITLPYEMLHSISAIRRDGSRVDIIRNGLFAVPGTEELNIPLLQILKQTAAKAKKTQKK